MIWISAVGGGRFKILSTSKRIYISRIKSVFHEKLETPKNKIGYKPICEIKG